MTGAAGYTLAAMSAPALDSLRATIDALCSDEEDARYDALDALEEITDAGALDGLAEDSTSTLLSLVADEDLDVSVAVIELVGRTRFARAIDALVERAEREQKSNPRCYTQRPFHAAIEAIARCAPGDPRVLACLTEKLRSIPEVLFRQSTIRALMVVGRTNAAARDALVALCESAEEWERVQARWALFGIDGDAPSHVPALVASLGSKSRGEAVSGAALLALRDIGAPALPALDEAAKLKGAQGRAAKELAAMIRSGKSPVDASLSVRGDS